MGFVTRAVDRLLEQRSELSVTSSAKPAAWLLDALGGGPTHAGTRVSEKTAASLSTVYACVRIISEDVGSLPLVLYERQPNGDRGRAAAHPLWRLTTTTANPEMPARPFRELVTAHAALWGAGFAEIELDNRARPIAFWPLLPGVTRAVRRRGAKYVVTTLPDGKQVGLEPGRYLHIPGPSWLGDGLNADHPVRMAREAIGLALAGEEFGARLFGNGARPSGMLTYEGKLTKEKRQEVIDTWNASVGGLSNAQRTALLEANLKWHAISINPDDAQSLETRKHQVEEVARYYRMPLFLLGHTEKATTWGTGLEQILRGYVTQTLRSWLTRWEEWYGHHVLDERDRVRYYVEHILEDLLKGDIVARYSAYATAVQNGWMNRDEVRERENMNRIEGGGGSAYTIQINMASLEDVAGSSALASAPRGGEVVLLADVARPPSTRSSALAAEPFRFETEARGVGSVLVYEPELGGDLRISWRSIGGVHRSESLGFPVRLAGLEDEQVERAAVAAREKARRLEAAQRSIRTRRRLQSRFLDVFEQSFGRATRRETAALRRLAKRLDEDASDALTAEAFVDEVRSFYELEELRAGRELNGHSAWLKREYLKPLTAYADLVQDEVLEERAEDEKPDGAQADVFLAAYVLRFLRRHAVRSVNQMRRLVDRVEERSELRAAVEAQLDDWDEKRPARLAAEESVHAGGAIARNTYFAVGVTAVEWVAFGGDCPLCEKLNGKVVGIQEVFLKKGDTVEPDDGSTEPLRARRSILHGPLDRGCDCSVAAS